MNVNDLSDGYIMERKIAMNKGERTEGGDNEANQTKTEEMYYFEYGISEQTADLLVKHQVSI